MDYQFYKRELFPSWQWDGGQRVQRSSEEPVLFSTEAASENRVVSKIAPEDMHTVDLSYKYALVAGLSCGLLLLLLLAAFIIAKRRRYKSDEEENRQSPSILVYPSSQTGRAPQFLTKDIHFSLPPLRSTSLGDLESQDHPYDSCDDVETESLLVSTQTGHRSYSFSCYGLGVIEPALYRSAGEGGLDLRDDWSGNNGSDTLARLWFSLRYEPHTEKLLVSLLKARDLPSRTMGTLNCCDPFVRLHLMPDERRFLQSKPKKKTCNPYFDETLVFQVSAKDMSDHTLKLTVIDGGRPKRKNEIGHVSYPLKDLEIGDGSEQQLFTMELEKEPQEIKSDLGELLVSLVYNENIGRLTATVIEARRLKVRLDR